MAQMADESYLRMVEQQASQGQDPADARLWVRFHLHPVQDQTASAAEGRPIFKELEYITIMVPGDKDNIVEREVWEQDRARFAKQYQHWKSTGQEAISGTPLEAYPGVTRAQVEELKFFGVRTVEDLAGIADAHAAKFMGIQALKQKAKTFLAAAAGSVPAHKVQADMEQKDMEIAALQRTLKEMGDKLEQAIKANRR